MTPVNQPPPQRQIRARHTETTIRVYQAYAPEIADPAVEAGTFVAPFKRERMTWIKPSFLWMAYRCGWGRKPGQECVLALDITLEGFDWALRHASLSHFERSMHADRQAWADQLKTSPVRVQWDPERDLHHRPLPYRSIQIGLSGEGVERYVDEWITEVTDVTPLFHTVGTHVANGDLDKARAELPDERPFTLAPEVSTLIGATR
jgi:hypothetical protein